MAVTGSHINQGNKEIEIFPYFPRIEIFLLIRCELQQAVCGGGRVKFKHLGSCHTEAGTRIHHPNIFQPKQPFIS